MLLLNHDSTLISVLTNNKKISVGYWTDDYVVDEIKEYTLQDLVGIGHWTPRICFFQLDNILAFIKKSFRQNENTNLLKFHHKRDSKQIVCERSEVPVLPEFYKKEIVG